MDDVIFNDLDDETEDQFIWEEAHRTDTLCIFCKKNMYIDDSGSKEYVIKCPDCPYSYYETSYMYSFYGFTIDQYLIYGCNDEEYLEERNSYPLKICIKNDDSISDPIGYNFNLPATHWIGTKEEILEKIKTILVFK